MNIRITPGIRRRNAYPWEDSAWISAATRDMTRINKALDQLGITQIGPITQDLDEKIGRVVTAFPEDFAPHGEHDRPQSADGGRSMFQAVRDWFNGLNVVEEETSIVSREVPLCLFNCPDAQNAKTTFAESSTTDGTAGWN